MRTPTPPGLDIKSNVNIEILSYESIELKILEETSNMIKRIKSQPIEFSKPIIKRNEDSIIFPNTINVIQGKAGVHKSRLAEIFSSAILTKYNCPDLLNLTKQFDGDYTLLYVDTERNQMEQLPAALQRIQFKAGFNIDKEPENFKYISLLEFERGKRFEILKAYISKLRKSVSGHVFIVLDVVTDCISNFNDAAESMKLIDLMNQMINRDNVTFLCLIHENPGSMDKARGHLGTELFNKSTTAIQIGYEKDSKYHNNDVLKINFLKCRSTRKLDPIFVVYSEEERTLVEVDSFSVGQRNDLDKTLDFLRIFLSSPKTRKEVLAAGFKATGCKERTLEKHLKSIIDDRILIDSNTGITCYLQKTNAGKGGTSYSLVPIEQPSL